MDLKIYVIIIPLLNFKEIKMEEKTLALQIMPIHGDVFGGWIKNSK